MTHPSASHATGRPLNLGELRTRAVAGAILAVGALLAAFLGGWPATLLLLALAALVAAEWLQVTRHNGLAPPSVAMFLLVLLSVGTAGAGQLGWALGLAIVGGMVLGLLARDFWLFAGVPYAAALGMGTLAVRTDPAFGWPALVFLFVTIWATDSAAYFAGRLIGGPKLWPSVSPKKTWAGAAGGLVGAVVAGSIAAAVFKVPITPGLIAVALVLSVVGQGGDLLESAIKRQFGVKDAGNIIPGHGGVMDRIDSLSVAAVGAALIGALHAGPEMIGRGLLLW